MQAPLALSPAVAAAGLALLLDHQHRRQQPLIWGLVYRKMGRERVTDRKGKREGDREKGAGTKRGTRRGVWNMTKCRKV